MEATKRVKKLAQTDRINNKLGQRRLTQHCRRRLEFGNLGPGQQNQNRFDRSFLSEHDSPSRVWNRSFQTRGPPLETGTARSKLEDLPLDSFLGSFQERFWVLFIIFWNTARKCSFFITPWGLFSLLFLTLLGSLIMPSRKKKRHRELQKGVCDARALKN